MHHNPALFLALKANVLRGVPHAAEPAEPYLGTDIELLGSDYGMGADYGMLGADSIELLGDDAANLVSLLGEDGAIQLLGAEARARKVRNNRIAKAPSKVIGRELFLPLPSTGVVTSLSTVIVNVQPQLTCQINQLVIPSTMGPAWLVNDVVIGTRSQFASPGAISAVALSEVQTGRLKGDTASLGTIISVSLTNISAGPQTLVGAFFRVYALV